MKITLPLNEPPFSKDETINLINERFWNIQFREESIRFRLIKIQFRFGYTLSAIFTFNSVTDSPDSGIDTFNSVKITLNSGAERPVPAIVTFISAIDTFNSGADPFNSGID
jgi:hypothetical protein